MPPGFGVWISGCLRRQVTGFWNNREFGITETRYWPRGTWYIIGDLDSVTLLSLVIVSPMFTRDISQESRENPMKGHQQPCDHREQSPTGLCAPATVREQSPGAVDGEDTVRDPCQPSPCRSPYHGDFPHGWSPKAHGLFQGPEGQSGCAPKEAMLQGAT